MGQGYPCVSWPWFKPRLWQKPAEVNLEMRNPPNVFAFLVRHDISTTHIKDIYNINKQCLHEFSPVLLFCPQASLKHVRVIEDTRTPPASSVFFYWPAGSHWCDTIVDCWFLVWNDSSESVNIEFIVSLDLRFEREQKNFGIFIKNYRISEFYIFTLVLFKWILWDFCKFTNWQSQLIFIPPYFWEYATLLMNDFKILLHILALRAINFR